MRTHRTAMTLAACAALFASVVAAGPADTVYKWTDAEGVTHYGDAPPAEGEYEASEIPVEHQAAAEAVAGAADVGPEEAAVEGEDPECAAVRRHLALLRGDAPVQQDTDGDGKADRILTQADREAQARLAEIMLAEDCTGPAD